MKISIDGREIVFAGRPTLLELARTNGIRIPSLCDQAGLRPFTGCRLCLVEIAGRRDYAPACGTYPEDGMSVRTATPELQALRRNILELILVEHPHACLVCIEKAECLDLKSTLRKAPDVTGCLQCPADGRCALQDVVRDVGLTRVRFPGVFRNLPVRRDDPFIDRDPNLCILCGKCVRVCEEARGAAVLSFAARGSETIVAAAYDRPLLNSGCRFCGACVDVCPTGALGERAVRNVPPAESVSTAVCPFCAQGCRLEIETRGAGIRLSRPAAEGPVNAGQACVKGRFLVREMVHAESRLRTPAVRRDGHLAAASWDEALGAAAAGLGKFTPGETALVFSPQASLEDAWMFLRFGHDVLRTEQVAAASTPSIWEVWAGLAAGQGMDGIPVFRLADIAEADAIIVVGADLPEGHPIAWLEAVRAAANGARLIFVGGVQPGTTFLGATRLGGRPGAEDAVLEALCREITRKGAGRRMAFEKIAGYREFRASLAAGPEAKVADTAEAINAGIAAAEIHEAAAIISRSRTAVVLFEGALAAGSRGPRALSLATNLARLAGARFMPLGRCAGERGIFELGRTRGPGAKFATAGEIVNGVAAGTIKAVYLAGPAPGIADVKPEFVVCQDTHAGPVSAAADVVFPAATFAEAEGTFVNTEGRIQSCRAAVALQGSALPDWRILSLLGRRMGAAGFGFDDARSLIKDIVRSVPAFAGADPAAFEAGGTFLAGSAARPEGFLPVGPAEAHADAEPDKTGGAEKGSPGAGRHGHACRSFDPVREVRGFARLERRKA